MAGKKLLVADDSLTIQKVIRLALSNEGYEIQAISDGADAIQQIATFRPDAVLVDVSLPTRSAFEIKREVNGMPDHAATRFVLMSSAFEKIDEAQAEEVGFDGHLTKPFDPAHLRQVLNEVLAAPPAPPAKAAKEEPVSIEAPPPVPSSLGIHFDPPADFPPSDFDPPAEESKPEEDELWGKHEELTPPPPPALSPAQDPVPEPMTENDEIRELTESTIRMSGLAEMPEIQPSDFDWKVNEPSLRPPSSMADFGDNDAPATPPAPPTSSELRGETSPNPLDVAGMPPMPAMEEDVRKQVQETLQSTLERIAREVLPEVAERVIKQEINRLLNEKV